MAEARLELAELAATLAREPDRIVEVTRRGRPVLRLMAPPRVARQASAARRILQQVALLGRGSTGKRRDVARRYKALLYVLCAVVIRRELSGSPALSFDRDFRTLGLTVIG